MDLTLAKCKTLGLLKRVVHEILIPVSTPVALSSHFQLIK